MRIDRIKFAAALAMADISSKELSTRSGLSRVTISSVKSGRRCSKTTAMKIASGLGVDISKLLSDEQTDEVSNVGTRY